MNSDTLWPNSPRASASSATARPQGTLGRSLDAQFSWARGAANVRAVRVARAAHGLVAPARVSHCARRAPG
eukprot:13343355-Alexandrium_andersonii.AAC.1